MSSKASVACEVSKLVERLGVLPELDLARLNLVGH